MKIKKIDGVTLLNSLWWEDYNDFQKIVSQAIPTITGGVIVYEYERDRSGINITLKTLSGSGWISKTNKDDLQDLLNNSLGQTFNIRDIEDNEIEVRFRHEVGSAIKFKRVVEAYESELFEVEIYLARV